jgi:hypothetical protein
VALFSTPSSFVLSAEVNKPALLGVAAGTVTSLPVSEFISKVVPVIVPMDRLVPPAPPGAGFQRALPVPVSLVKIYSSVAPATFVTLLSAVC